MVQRLKDEKGLVLALLGMVLVMFREEFGNYSELANTAGAVLILGGFVLAAMWRPKRRRVLPNLDGLSREELLEVMTHALERFDKMTFQSGTNIGQTIDRVKGDINRLAKAISPKEAVGHR